MPRPRASITHRHPAQVRRTGFPRWGRTLPHRLACPDCGGDVRLLLAMPYVEWADDDKGKWRPIEVTSLDDPTFYQPPNQPTMITVHGDDTMQIFVCAAAPEHRHLQNHQ
jgi:hypothetical protein